MKLNYIIPSALACMAFIAGGCSDNAWNEHYVEDFNPNDTYSKAITVRYDLTKDDYATIGNGLYNKDNSQEEKDAANAIKNNLYFNQQSCYPMEYAMSWFLDRENTDFQVYDLGSKVQVGLAVAFGAPEQLSKVAAAKRIIFSEPVETNAINDLLKQNYPDAIAGQYAIVSYPGTNSNPGSGSGSGSGSGNGSGSGSGSGSGNGSGSTSTELTSNIKDLSSGATLTATAVVTAQSTRGLILTDKAGSIFYYNNNVDLTAYPIGTIVNVSGTVEVYGGFQLTNTATLTKVGSQNYTYPTPTTYTSSMISAAISANTPNTAQYISFEGTLDINGNYFNINIPGVDNGQGSLYTPTDALKNKLESGKTYTFTGYFTGITSGKYFYMVLTDATDVSTKTRAANWTVSEALSQIAGGYDGEAIVEGYVISITELSTSYGNATYVIADKATDTEGLTVYRGYYLNGEKFTSEDQLKIGDFVVVSGSLVNYGGTTPEFTTGNKIISINGEGGSSGGGSTDTPPAASLDEATAINVVYLFDGSKWSIPDEDKDEDQLPVVTVDSSAYSEMGLKVNQLTDPNYYLPTYMKLKYPYINTQTAMVVAYNINSSGCATSILICDGSNWTVNNIYLQNRVAEFAKTSEGYQFRKYIGEETYLPFIGEELQMNAGYLLVADGYNYCAGPVTPTSGFFGYMYPQDIEIDNTDGSITLNNSENTFTFLTKIDINGTTYETPEGKFLIQQADGNLIYLSGPTYYNFGIQSDPYYSTSNGEFKDSYLWSAEKQTDGSWMVYCDYLYNNEMYHKVIYYADNYQNFANYTDAQLSTHPEAVMLKLYISEDDMSSATDNPEEE